MPTTPKLQSMIRQKKGMPRIEPKTIAQGTASTQAIMPA